MQQEDIEALEGRVTVLEDENDGYQGDIEDLEQLVSDLQVEN